MIITKRKAQSTLEVVVLIVIVSVAVILMQKYIKRAVQGKLRDSASQIGDPWTYEASPTTVVLEKNTYFEAKMTDRTDPTGQQVTEYKAVQQNGYIKTNVEALNNDALHDVW